MSRRVLLSNGTLGITSARVTAIVVIHNSPAVVESVVRALLNQTHEVLRIVVVDSGSHDQMQIRTLERLSERVVTRIHSNIGFAAANNLAIREFRSQTDYFALINPDLILTPNWIEGALRFIRNAGSDRIGIVSSPTLGLDANTEIPTGRWDTLGIYRKSFGRWKEPAKQCSVLEVSPPDIPFEPQAVLGALMFFSIAILDSPCCVHGFFDEGLFTFKEDIEVSLRLRRCGYRLVMLPSLVAYHCRGWPNRRFHAPFWTRRISSRNDVIIAARYFPWELPLFLLKYAYCVTLERVVLSILGFKEFTFNTRQNGINQRVQDGESSGIHPDEPRSAIESSSSTQLDVSVKRAKPAAFLVTRTRLEAYTRGATASQCNESASDFRSAVKLLNAQSFLVFLIAYRTTQVVGYDAEMSDDLSQARVRALLASSGAWIDDFRHSLRSESNSEYIHSSPSEQIVFIVGDIKKLAEKWSVDVTRSFLVADHPADVDSARAEGIIGYLYDGGSLLRLISDRVSRAQETQTEFAKD